jgi:acetyl esterase
MGPRLQLIMVLAAAAAVFSGAAAAHPTAPLGSVHAQYGPDPGQDVYVYPNADPGHPEPIVVLVHGGGWSGGDAAGVADVATELAIAGYVVFNVNYPLDSEGRPGYPMQQNSVANATIWAIAHAADYGANPALVNLFGESAGATIAARVGELLNAARPTVRTVVSLSGRMTFVDFQHHLGNVGNGFDPVNNIPKYLGCTFSYCPLAVERAASPLENVTDRAPTFLILNGQNEHIPLDQARRMAAALGRHHRDVTLTILPGTDHALQYFDLVLPEIEEFLALYG